MFVIQPALARLVASPGEILLLLTSLNRPMVALEDYATDEADATICTVRRESDMVSTLVHLLLQQGRVALFYKFESDPYPVDLRGPVEEEALDFVESLGFIMDDTRFASLGPDEQKELLERPLFTGALSDQPAADQAEGAFEVPPDPAFQYEPMTKERLDAMDDLSAQGLPPAASQLPSAPLEAPITDPPGPPALPVKDEVFQVALAESSLQEMEIVLDEVFQDSAGTRPARREAPAAIPAEPSVAPPDSPVASGSGLSRFRRRREAADLVTIQEVGGEERIVSPAEGAPAVHSQDTAPQSLPTRDSANLPPEAWTPAEPDARRRRARARFLASF